MAADCIFCSIAAREAEASVVYENELVLAFLDLRQFHPGHTLVVPKAHLADIYDLHDDGIAAALLSAVARVARSVRDLLAPEGVNVWRSTGAAAGQEVFHLHFHVVPRYEGDGLIQFYPSKPANPDRAELGALAAKLRGA